MPDKAVNAKVLIGVRNTHEVRLSGFTAYHSQITGAKEEKEPFVSRAAKTGLHMISM